MFPNRIKNGSIMKSGPIWHETLLARRIQPVARDLGLPHITWRLLRHWGATQMVEANTPIKAVQQRLGHSRPNTVLIYYARPRQVGGLGGIVGERTAERSTHDRGGWNFNHFQRFACSWQRRGTVKRTAAMMEVEMTSVEADRSLICPCLSSCAVARFI